MGVFMLIVNIASLLIKLPDIWKQIKMIWEIIEFLREAGKNVEDAEKELGGILVRYIRGRKRKGGLQGANDSIRSELAALERKLRG